MEITWLELARGRGSRMGSVDKGRAMLGGQAMVQHVLARLRQRVQRLLISANQTAEHYAAYGAPVWPDAVPDFAGPLAGLQTGLMHCETPYLGTAPCDSPFLPTDLVERLSAGLVANGADIAVALIGEGETRHPHPVFCLTRVSVLPHLNLYLQGGGRKMERWYSTLRVAEVHFADEAAIRNINTLDELHQSSG